MPERQKTYYVHMSSYLAPEKNQSGMYIRNQNNFFHKNGYILPCYYVVLSRITYR